MANMADKKERNTAFALAQALHRQENRPPILLSKLHY